MRLNRIFEAIDEIAPFSLSREYCEKYGAYDNSGIILDCGGEIEKIVFSLDCSAAAVGRAKEIGANCIITHHPAIFTPLKALSEREGKNVLACAREGVSVISAHLNLDCAPNGIDECLMRGLGGEHAVLMHKLSSGGYGRVYDVTDTDAAAFEERTRNVFHSARTVLYGEGKINRVASFCGAGLDEETVAFAAEHGAQLVVSSDVKHHVLCEAVERGLAVLILPHYAAEQYGFQQFFQSFIRKTGAKAEYYADARFI